jgi:hypothetical protein
MSNEMEVLKMSFNSFRLFLPGIKYLELHMHQAIMHFSATFTIDDAIYLYDGLKTTIEKFHHDSTVARGLLKNRAVLVKLNV